MHKKLEESLRANFPSFIDVCADLVDLKSDTYLKAALSGYINENNEYLFDKSFFKKFILATKNVVNEIFLNKSSTNEGFEIVYPFTKEIFKNYPKFGTELYRRYRIQHDCIQFESLELFFVKESNIELLNKNSYELFFPELTLTEIEVKKYKKNIRFGILNYDTWFCFIMELITLNFSSFHYNSSLSNKNSWIFTKKINDNFTYGFIVSIKECLNDLRNNSFDLPDNIKIFYCNTFDNRDLKVKDLNIISKLENPFFPTPSYKLSGYIAIDEHKQFQESGIIYKNTLEQIDSNKYLFRHFKMKYENIVKYTIFYFDVLASVNNPYLDYIENSLLLLWEEGQQV